MSEAVPLFALSCDRRSLLVLAGLAVATFRSTTANAAPFEFALPAPVTAYFDNGLILDTSGQLPAYIAPRGYRGGQAVGAMSEVSRRSLNPYL